MTATDAALLLMSLPREDAPPPWLAAARHAFDAARHTAAGWMAREPGETLARACRGIAARRARTELVSPGPLVGVLGGRQVMYG